MEHTLIVTGDGRGKGAQVDRSQIVLRVMHKNYRCELFSAGNDKLWNIHEQTRTVRISIN